jgi:gas vesicle protein
MNNGKVLLGVLAGIAAGTVLGILLAPEKGANTRKNILKKGGDLANRLNKNIDQKFAEIVDTITSKEKKSKTQTSTVNVPKSEMVE